MYFGLFANDNEDGNDRDRDSDNDDDDGDDNDLKLLSQGLEWEVNLYGFSYRFSEVWSSVCSLKRLVNKIDA